jgi:hypothetical protein
VAKHLRLRLFFILISALLAFGFPLAAKSQDSAAIKLTASAGFDGYFKEGHWIPVHIIAENIGPSLDGRIEVSLKRLNNATSAYTYPISLPNTSRKEFFLYIYPESYYVGRDIKISLIANNTEVASTNARLTAVRDIDLLFGVISGSPSEFNLLADLDPTDGDAFVAQLDMNGLPDRSAGLSGLDILVISNVDTGAISESQLQSLRNWLVSGGRLLVTGGPNWQKTAAGLSGLLPLSPRNTQSLSDLSSLSSFSQSQFPIVGGAKISTGALTEDAQTLVSQSGYPLILTRPLGLGSIIYLSVDPSLEPLRRWGGLENLYGQLLNADQDLPGWADGFQNWDFAAQAIASLPSLAAPSALLFCGFLSLYVIALGPVNFVILRKLKRRELAWFSIPGLVLLFSMLSYLIGSQMRGNQPLISRMAIVQVWPGSSTARVDGLLGVFSPNRSTYRVEIGSGFLAHPIPTSARVLSGGNWTIMQDSAGVTLPDLRVEVGGLEALAVEGNIPAPQVTHDLKLYLDSQGASLQGSIANQSALTLDGAVLIAPGKTQQLGDFKPGDTRDISINLHAAGRAAQSGQSPNVTTSGSGIVYFNPGADTLAMDILGTSNYYQDKEINRRYLLLNALLSTQNGKAGPGGGVYLTGWASGSPIPASLQGKKASDEDTTLYIFNLSPSLDFRDNRLSIPPALFSWTTLSPGPTDHDSPYETRLFPGSYAVKFSLSQPLRFSSVQALTLHLKSSGTQGSSGLQIYLWNYLIEDWISFGKLDWGDFSVANPEKFVGPGGEVRLKIENQDSAAGINIESADFSLVVER